MTRQRDVIRIMDEPDTVSFQEAWAALALHLWQTRGVDINAADHPLQIAVKPCPIAGSNMRGMAILAAPRGITDHEQFCRAVVLAYFGERTEAMRGVGIVADGMYAGRLKPTVQTRPAHAGLH